MNITLNIQNDAELRAFIKDAIKGQILSIVREEFIQIVKEEIERKLKGSDKYAFERMQKEATTEVVKSILYKKHSVSRWNTDFIKPIVESVVKESIAGKDWKTMIDTLAKEKVRQLIS
jgi:hypothetical protein